MNHDGSLDKALNLIEAAANAGADVVKFQTFIPENIATKSAPKAKYQLQNSSPTETQLEMLKALTLSADEYKELLKHCDHLNIDFLSTPFDLESLHFLCELGVKKIKIGSGDLNNAPLLLAAARTQLPVILSTGMSTLSDIEEAVSVLAFGYCRVDEKPSKDGFFEAWQDEAARSQVRTQVTLLHCTSQYPAPFDEVNLKAMATLKHTFGLDTGYSDHTNGISIAIAAAALGASVLEKHITLDKTSAGPDHAASLEPAEFKDMVNGIRQACLALGSSEKTVTLSELSTREVARKSLVASVEIEKGDTITADKIGFKRPAMGRPPIDYWEVLGTKASKKITKDDFL